MASAKERIGSALAQHGYEQIKTVGEGSFGKAILVRHTTPSDGKNAVIKMIDVNRASRKEREDALKESQVLSSLKHTNIVRYHSNFLAEGWLCIVMDYCEGGDLSSRIKKTKAKGTTFSEDQVLWWLTQGLQALSYIHDLHILHRDLKSGNFFLSKSGNLKLGDFGIAKVLDCTAALAQTQVGTPYYMCPEICKGKSYSWGSDMWAMGCVLYEMCALRVPFNGHDLKSLISAITKAAVPELPSQYKALQDVSHKLLSRNPAMRMHADDILGMPLVRETAKKMQGSRPTDEVQRPSSACERPSSARPQSARPQSARPQSAAGSEDRPQSSAGSEYSAYAGTFSKKDKVEYYSGTHNEWLPASVIDVDGKRQILMDVKPKTWISVEIQGEKVRPRQMADAKEQKCPSGAGGVQRQRRPSVPDKYARPESARRDVMRRNSAAARLGA